MERFNVLLVMGREDWTSKALHLACAMARSNNGQVTLIRMVAAGHPALLGTPEGHRHVTDHKLLELAELLSTAEKYDVAVNILMCQYANFTHGLVSAVEQLHAVAVFVLLPTSAIPLWGHFRAWWLQRSLARAGCVLHTVEPGGSPLEWTPSATQPYSSGAVPQSKES